MPLPDHGPVRVYGIDLTRLFSQAKTYVSPEEIFRNEPDEAKEKVSEALRVCRLYRQLYDNRKSHLADYYKDRPDAEVRLWDFDSKLVFARYMTFLSRLATMEELFSTILEFSKLEKVDFTGIKGNSLCTMVQQLFTEFQEHVAVFAQRTYDALDPQNGVCTLRWPMCVCMKENLVSTQICKSLKVMKFN